MSLFNRSKIESVKKVSFPNDRDVTETGNVSNGQSPFRELKRTKSPQGIGPTRRKRIRQRRPTVPSLKTTTQRSNQKILIWSTSHNDLVRILEQSFEFPSGCSTWVGFSRNGLMFCLSRS